MKKIKVLFRFPNDFAWLQYKIQLSELNIVRIFDDEVFAFLGNNYIAIKKDTLPKDFLTSKGG